MVWCVCVVVVWWCSVYVCAFAYAVAMAMVVVWCVYFVCGYAHVCAVVVLLVWRCCECVCVCVCVRARVHGGDDGGGLGGYRNNGG